MSRSNNPFSGIVGVPIDPKTGEVVKGLSEKDNFYTCPACGQSVDKRDLGEVFHHEDAGHQPLPSN